MCAIATLLASPNLRQRLGANGKRLVSQGYSWKAIAYIGILIMNSEPSPGEEIQVSLPPCFSTTI